ncbi:MAG: protein BatD [Bdellovibrionales bacterium]|nr:protein BatD [Bdellovibrionales bacterium]
MKKIGKLTLIFLMFFTAVAFGESPIEVQSTVDRNQMSEGDTFTLTITVSSSSSVSVEEPKLPDLNDFDLLNTWRGASTHSTFENGTFKTIRQESFHYMLAPKRKGKVTISSAIVNVNGRSIRTKPIEIAVLDSRGNKNKIAPRQAPNNSTDPFEDLDDMFSQMLRRRQVPGFKTQPSNPKEAFFIQLEVDKSKAYVGEQITASWYLYTRGHVTEIDTLKYPSLNGFWKEDIEVSTRLNWEQEVINGLVYRKALLASYALFPIKEGKVKIDSYKAKCKVITRGNFGFMGQAYEYTKASKEVKVDVLPIPTDKMPKNFSGAVGVFTLKSTLNKDDLSKVKVNEPISYTIRFEGKGNAKLIDLPSLELPPSLELYDTKKDSKFFKTGKSYKEFELLIIPREAGEVEIPETTISLFNPETAEFYDQKIPGYRFTVLPGDDSQKMASTPLTNQAGEQPKAQVYSPALVVAWQESSSQMINYPMWIGLILLSLMILGWRFYVENGFGQKQKNISEELKRRIKLIYQKIDRGEWREVGVDGTNAIYFVFGAVSEEGGAHVELEQLLLKTPPSVRRELSQPLSKLMEKLERIGFAPEGVVGSLKDKEEQKKLIGQLEKILNRAITLGVQTTESSKSGDSFEMGG